MAILVNGNGNARVYAAQDADLIASITGNQTVRTSVGNKMAATAADASTISVADGVILTKEGRRIQLDAGQTDLFTIPTGSAGVTNYYIIGYKLTTNSDNVQVAETFVQLMASSTDTIPEGTFRGGDSEVYVSVARVEQDGVNLGTITALLPELETISELNNDLGDLSTLDTTDKSSLVAAINEVLSQIGGGGMKPVNTQSQLLAYSPNATITPTRDCVVAGIYRASSPSSAATLKVNGVTAGMQVEGSAPNFAWYYPIKAGQTVLFEGGTASSGTTLGVYDYA